MSLHLFCISLKLIVGKHGYFKEVGTSSLRGRKESNLYLVLEKNIHSIIPVWSKIYMIPLNIKDFYIFDDFYKYNALKFTFF